MKLAIVPKVTAVLAFVLAAAAPLHQAGAATYYSHSATCNLDSTFGGSVGYDPDAIYNSSNSPTKATVQCGTSGVGYGAAVGTVNVSSVSVRVIHQDASTSFLCAAYLYNTSGALITSNANSISGTSASAQNIGIAVSNTAVATIGVRCDIPGKSGGNKSKVLAYSYISP